MLISKMCRRMSNFFKKIWAAIKRLFKREKRLFAVQEGWQRKKCQSCMYRGGEYCYHHKKEVSPTWNACDMWHRRIVRKGHVVTTKKNKK